jgi:WS/DGAT/MGAT family acyltransferase
MTGATAARPVDRASPADLMQMAVGDGGVASHVGAVLVLDTGPGFSVAEAQRLFGERIRAIPRLRQRLRRAPPGCGSPFWADDPAFDAGAHIRQARCPPPGDERALLDLAAAQLARPLPPARPLWSAMFVTGLADGGTGLIVVMDHVLADGVAGLAVLARLVDQAAGPAMITARGVLAPGVRPVPGPFPVPAPSVRALAADAWASRLRHIAEPRASLRRFRQGLAELGGARPPRALPPTSLNRPVGPRRRIDLVTADLAAVRGLGHARGGTVNDVVLAAVAGALRALLAARGEELPQVTVSVPVSARRPAGDGKLGNQVGVMLVTVPAGGGLGARVSRVAAITRGHKSQARGASAALLVPVFLLLARIGLLRWFASHQRSIHTFVTNLRGPEEPFTFAAAPVRALIAIPVTTGNVTVTFGVLSYAGKLRITVMSDPGRMPDAPALAAALRAELDGLTARTLAHTTGSSSPVSHDPAPRWT